MIMKQYIGLLLRKWSNKLLSEEVVVKLHKKELVEQISKHLIDGDFVNTNVGEINDDWIKDKFIIVSNFKFRF